MHESNGCVAVIIPSRNRAHWVKKRLSAYARNPDGIHIYLADSSDRADRAVLERESKYWADQGLRLNYAWSQPQGPLPAIAQALDQVSQSWITFCGDDDQQLEFSLARATRFLEQNPDCVAAHGQGVLFELNSRDQPVGFSLYGVTDCSGPAHLISNYYCPLFLVSRADAFKKSIQVGLKLKHQIFRQELGASIALALQGRLAHIPGAGFIRQTHQSHFALTADPTLFDPGIWNPAVKELQAALFHALGKGLNPDDLEKLELYRLRAQARPTHLVPQLRDAKPVDRFGALKLLRFSTVLGLGDIFRIAQIL